MGAAVLVNYKTARAARTHNKTMSEREKKNYTADRLLIKNIGLHIHVHNIYI